MGVKLGLPYQRKTVGRRRVLQKRTLRTSGRKTEKVRGDWGILHGSHGLCCSPCSISMVKQRRLCCAGHVARVEEMRNVCKH